MQMRTASNQRARYLEGEVSVSKRFISYILAFVLVFSLMPAFPTAAYAIEEGGQESEFNLADAPDNNAADESATEQNNGEALVGNEGTAQESENSAAVEQAPEANSALGIAENEIVSDIGDDPFKARLFENFESTLRAPSVLDYSSYPAYLGRQGVPTKGRDDGETFLVTLINPLSQGVDSSEGGSSSKIAVVTDTDKYLEEEEGVHPGYYYNILVDSLDASSALTFSFDFYGPGGNNTKLDNNAQYINIYKSPDPAEWTSENRVWQASATNTTYRTGNGTGGGAGPNPAEWVTRFASSVPANTLQANETYYFTITHGLNTSQANRFLNSDIVFEFSTDLEREGSVGDNDGQDRIIGYTGFQGLGSNLTMTSPLSEDIKMNFTRSVERNCYYNAFSDAVIFNSKAPINFDFALEGGGSKHQDEETWKTYCMPYFKVYSDIDISGASPSFDVSDLVAEYSNGSGALSFSGDFKTGTSITASIAADTLEANTSYYLVIEPALTVSSDRAPIGKQIIFEFKTLDEEEEAPSNLVLANAITEAKTTLQTPVISEDGATVPSTKTWVSQAVFDAFSAAIAAAELVRDNESATVAELTAALSALSAAKAIFTTAEQQGSFDVSQYAPYIPQGASSIKLQLTHINGGTEVMSNVYNDPAKGNASSEFYNLINENLSIDGGMSFRYVLSGGGQNNATIEVSGLGKVHIYADEALTQHIYTPAKENFTLHGGGSFSFTIPDGMLFNEQSYYLVFDPSIETNSSRVTGARIIFEFRTAAQTSNTAIEQLKSAIASAKSALSIPKISADGSGITKLETWVEQSSYDTFNEAITTAEALSEDSGASDVDIDNATKALEAARKVFIDAQKQGDNPFAQIQWEIGSPTASDVIAVLYDDGNLSFEGNGDVQEYPAGRVPWYSNRAKILSGSFEDGVAPKSLAWYFSSCPNLTKVESLPNGVESVRGIFSSCYKLEKSPAIPDSVKDMTAAFDDCLIFSEAPVLPDGVTNLSSTFRLCRALTQAPAIPDGVTTLASTFDGCSKLTQAPAIPDSVTTLERAFSASAIVEAPVIPNSVTNMVSAFSSCASLVKAPVIPNSVTNMSSTFVACTSLTEVPLIPHSVTDMTRTFYDCPSITTIPDDFVFPSGAAKSTTFGLKSPYSASNLLKTYVNAPASESVLNYNWAGAYRELVVVEVDTLQLDRAINRAKTLADSTFVSVDGDDVQSTKMWASKSEHDIFGAVIADAEAVRNNSGASVDEQQSAQDALEAAIEAFKQVRKPGAKRAIVQVWEIGSPTAADVSATLYDDGALEIEGEGATVATSPWPAAYKPQIKSVSFEEGVKPTNLAQYFYGCTNLVEVSGIPDTVTNMSLTFLNCAELSKISNFPSGLLNMMSAFDGCTSLREVPELPQALVSAPYAFRRCSSLVKAPLLPNALVNANDMFYDCSSLSELPEGFVIPDSAINVNNMFYGCNSLNTLPDGFRMPEGIVTSTTFRALSPYNATNLLKTYINAPVDPTIAALDWASYNRELVILNKLASPVLAVSGIVATSDSIKLVECAPSSEDASALVEYRCSADGGTTYGSWQASPLFEGLDSDTTYHFQARYLSGDENFSDSEPCAALSTKTLKSLKSGLVFDTSKWNAVYNESPQAVSVLPLPGVGAISIYYNGAAAAPTNAGSYVVTVDIASGTDPSYPSATALELGTFTIAKAPAPKIEWPSASALRLGQTLASSKLSGGTIKYGSFAWEDASIVPTLTNSGYPVKFTPSANTLANYQPVASLSKNVKVSVTNIEVPGEKPDKKPWSRLAGTDRYKTMQQIVKKGFDAGTSDTVIIATGENYPDALAASSLAGLSQSAIILTPKAMLALEAKSEIVRLKARKAIIIGSDAAVSSKVEKEIKALGLSTERVAGVTRVETAVAIYEKGKTMSKWSKTAIIASSQSFADALSISSYAYAKNIPIFLSDGNKVLTKEVLTSLRADGFNDVIIVGSDAVVSKKVETQLASIGLSANKVIRLAGTDRYDTSLKIARFTTSNGLSANGIALTTGDNFPDALAGAALCGKSGSVILLTNENSKQEAGKFVASHAKEIVWGCALGSKEVLSESVLSYVEARSK